MSDLVLYPALLAAFMAFVIALHHLYVHSLKEYDRAREESCAVCCYLQPSDCANHEIWVVSLLAVSITWGIAGAVMLS